MRKNEFISEKQKGVDGKACWKGYKRMGTKQKGGRTVDNCVKAENLELEKDHDELPMAMSDLYHSAKSAIQIIEMLKSAQGQELEGWVQEKITKAQDYLNTVREYLEGKSVAESIEEKTDPSVCRSPKRLGRSDHSSCVSQGLRPHNSKGKGHTDGHGNYLKGKKAKSVHYGGSVKDYDGKS